MGQGIQPIAWRYRAAFDIGIAHNGYYHYLCVTITEAIPRGELHTGGCGVIGSHVRLRI